MTAQGTTSVSWAEKKTTAPAPDKPRSLARQLREQFRAAAKAAIQTLAPSPAQRRKRREETWGGFKMAAAPVMCHTTPARAFFHAALFLQDTLDWLHLWNWNRAPPDGQLDHFDYPEQHHPGLDL
jgi:hypothetical protein